jgi:hypothetical protein
MADEKDQSPSATAQMPRVRRRAPTIELKATEVAVERPPSPAAESPPAQAEAEAVKPPEYSTEPPPYEASASAPPSPPEPPPPQQEPGRPAFSGRPVVEAALAGGLVALIVFVALWLGGAFAGPDESASDRRLASIEAQLREIASRPMPANPEARLDELAGRIGRLESAPRANANAPAPTTGIEEAIKPLQNAVGDVVRRLDDTTAAVREARTQADAALVAADAARLAVERTNVDVLGNRIAALEGAVKALTDDLAKGLAAAGDRPLRAAVTAQALQAAVERGDAFVAELAAAKATAANPQTLAPLESFAGGGLPSAAALARQLSDLAPTMLKTTEAPAPAGGFLDRLQANAEKLVRIRPAGEMSGDDPAAVLSRAQAKAARADLSGAVAELNALPANVRAPAEDWIKTVQARNTALNASRRLVADALTALGRPSP